MTKFTITNELLGATVSNSTSAADLQALKSDPRGFILSQTNTDVSAEVSFNFAENSGDTVHVALPYYSQLDAVVATAIDSDELDSVSGGEIFVSVTTIMVDNVTKSIEAGTAAGNAAAASNKAAAMGLVNAIGAAQTAAMTAVLSSAK